MFSIKKVKITGMGAVTSLSHNIPSLLDALKKGRSNFKLKKLSSGSYTSIAEISEWSLDKALTVYQFNTEFLLKIKKLIGRESLQIQTAVVSTIEALHDADLLKKPDDLAKMSIVIAGSNFYKQRTGFPSPKYALQFFDSYLMSVISELFDIKGEGFTIGAASASGNMALIQAKRLLESGYYKKCLVVAPFFDFGDLEYQGFETIGAMFIRANDQFDPKAVCRPFDYEHSGFIYGQSCGAIVLETDPKKNKSNIYISGTGVSLDAQHTSEPSVEGETKAMKSALQNAKLNASQINYLNPHGTSAALGDETEVKVIQNIFFKKNNIFLNTTKSILGHGITSAGLVETIVTVLQMQNDFLHTSLNLENPIIANLQWIKKTKQTKINHALKNSFGFGGINTSLVISKI